MDLKPAALFVCAHAPHRSARQAGQKTAQLYLEELQEKYRVDTLILCSAASTETKAALDCESAIGIHVFDRLKKVLSVLTGALRSVPPRFATRLSRGIIREIVAIIAKSDYEMIWLEFSQVAWLLPVVKRVAGDQVKVVLSLHDIQHELVLRKSWVERIAFGKWTRAYERKLLRMADRVRVQSTKDKELIERLAGLEVDVEVRDPAMSSFVRLVNRSDDQIRRHSLLFWGAMNRSENSSAALRFIRQTFPRIVKRFPDASIFVVGASPPEALKALTSERIVVTGFMEDPTIYFAQASLGVVPLMEGAGIKVKTLEMLAAGLRVVSTPIGAEGITSSPNLYVSNIEDMADVIFRLWSK
jgi:glycosyltransferase involved in cell wall biosynthesis